MIIILSHRLRDLRHQRGWSQRELAKRAGIHHPTICHIESGKRIPTLPTMQKLAQALHIDVSDLFA